MPAWIALLRGINVGGNSMLPMAKLKVGLESIGLSKVQTYIQSGNVVFESTARSPGTLAKKIGDLVEREHGFRPQVMLLTGEELRTAIENNPYPGATDDPKSLHFFFLAQPATRADLPGLDQLKAVGESYELIDQVFYLNATEGIGRSKLAARAEKLLGVAATARNYRTVAKLDEMVTGLKKQA